MSWRASAYFKQLRQCPNGDPISRGEKFVGLILADSHQDKTGAYTYPSVETLAGDALMDERTCRRILSSLERKGVIRRLRGDHQGRGQLTFYSFPELDETEPKANGKGGHPAPLSPVDSNEKGGQNTRLVSAKRRAKGGQKEDKIAPHTVGRTGTETQKQKQKIPPHVPPTGAGGSSVAWLFDGQASIENKPETGPPAGAGPRIDCGIEQAIEQIMSGCTWTKRRLREKLRAVISLEFDKGEPPATTALAIMAAWRFQTENSHFLRGKFGPANFLELGVWKNANLLQWDHQRMDRTENGARL